MGDERVYFILQLLGHKLTLRGVRKQGGDRNLEGGTEAEATGFFSLVFSACFLIQPMDSDPG